MAKAVAKAGSRCLPEQGVFPCRGRKKEPMPVPVLGDISDASFDLERSRRQRTQAADDFGEFTLAVALDARDGENFAGHDLERDLLERDLAARAERRG